MYQLYSDRFHVCMPVYACLDVCVVVSGCQECERQAEDKWQWNTDWQNEREPLFVVCWLWPQTDQSAHDFHQLAQGFQHP